MTEINISGLDALASFTIEKYDNRVIKTFIIRDAKEAFWQACHCM